MTVAAYHLPPVALAILRRFSSAAALCADKPASWAITGRIRSARAAASLALRSDPAVQPPSSHLAAWPRGEACLGPLRNERPLLLRQRGEQVEDEGVNVGAETR